ncbi:hypothetical protein BKA62DRAFT_701533 [Auriculariales sp. MPI-PUGE-AT-0066]|nr:hypothetical protein BKA62DRAFT_701533 [Auriculariales sp. MPI-PUGE-AT-0066]
MQTPQNGENAETGGQVPSSSSHRLAFLVMSGLRLRTWHTGSSFPHAQLASLPFDVVCQIMETIYRSDGQQGVRSLCLVSRLFNDAATPFVFRTVVLHTEARMATFTDYAARGSPLLRHVRHLSPWRDFCHTDQMRAGAVIAACDRVTHLQTTLGVLLNFCYSRERQGSPSDATFDSTLNEGKSCGTAPTSLFLWVDSGSWDQLLRSCSLLSEPSASGSESMRHGISWDQVQRLHIMWLDFERVAAHHHFPAVFSAAVLPALEVFSTGWTRDFSIAVHLSSSPSSSQGDVTEDGRKVQSRCPFFALSNAVLSLPKLQRLIYRVAGQDVVRLRSAFFDSRQQVLDVDKQRKGSTTSEGNLQTVWLNDVKGHVSMWDVDLAVDTDNEQGAEKTHKNGREHCRA